MLTIRGLKEVCVGSVGLEQRSSGLLDARRERELDVVVVHLLDNRSPGVLGGNGAHAEDLNGVCPGAMTGSHVSVALRDGVADSQVAVLTVHVVGSGPGVVLEPNAEVLDGLWPLLADLLDVDDLTVGLLDLLQLTQEVPEPGFGDNMVWSEDPHLVKWRLWSLGCRQVTADDHVLLESPLGLHFRSQKKDFRPFYLTCRSEKKAH